MRVNHDLVAPYEKALICLQSRQDWFTVYEHNRRPNCTVSDLVIGNEYSFRVFSENVCGPSEEPGVSSSTALICKTGKSNARLKGLSEKC